MSFQSAEASRPFRVAALAWAVQDRAKLRKAGSARWLRIAHSLADLWHTGDDVAGRLVVVANLTDADLVQRLQWIHVPRDVPLFLATRLDAENLRQLKDVVVDEVVDWDGSADTWEPTLKRHAQDLDFRAVAEAARNIPALPQLVRIALIRLALADPPFPTVKALANSLGVTPTGLRYHFKPLLEPWRLQDLVDWFVLLRCGWVLGCRKSVWSGSQSAVKRPTRRTLNGMAQRLLDKSLATLRTRPAAGSHPILRFVFNATTIR